MMKEQTYMEEGREPVFFGFVGFFRLGVRRLSPRELENFPHAVRRAERQPDKPFTFNPINLYPLPSSTSTNLPGCRGIVFTKQSSSGILCAAYDFL